MVFSDNMLVNKTVWKIIEQSPLWCYHIELGQGERLVLSPFILNAKEYS